MLPRPIGLAVSLRQSKDGELIGELRDLLIAFLAKSAAEVDPDRCRWRYEKWPSPGRVIGLGRHGEPLYECRFVNAGSAKGSAVGCDLVILDEAGLLAERDRSMVAKLYSSTSNRRGRVIALGAQYDGFVIQDLKARRHLPSVHVVEYAAPRDVDILDDVALEAAMRAANPGIEDGIKPIEELWLAAERARASPGFEATFRADDLNQPQDVERELIVSLADWQRVAEGEPAERVGGCVVGLDAGGSSSMTAAAAYWPSSGRLEVRAALPNVPSLAEREAADRVPPGTYASMVSAGELALLPGRVTPLAEFIRRCGAWLAGVRVLAMGADRYRAAEVIGAMEAAEVRWPYGKLSWRGLGAGATAHGSADVRAFQRAVLSRKLSCAEGRRLLAFAIERSKLGYDGAGNPKVEKSGARSRIDALQCSVIATGLGELVGGERGKWQWA